MSGRGACFPPSAELLVQTAANDAAVKPCKLILSDQSIDTFFSRLRERLHELLDAGRLPAGEYGPTILVGASRVTVLVRIQADLFGPASISIDTAGLREILERERGD